jgi:hypothetical protein
MHALVPLQMSGLKRAAAMQVKYAIARRPKRLSGKERMTCTVRVPLAGHANG